MKHFIIAIGWIGNYECYLDIPLEEAKRRFLEQGHATEVKDDMVRVIKFEDHFAAYDIYDA